MSARAWSRVTQIQHELKNTSVVALQGTRIPQKSNQFIECNTSDGWTCYHAGYHSMCSSHTGVSLCFNNKVVCPETIQYYWVPKEQQIQGRVVGVRERGPKRDIMHICIYFPPTTSKNAVNITNMICDAITKLVQGLPSRCMPIMYMDANSEFGMEKCKGGQRVVNTRVCGGENLGLENSNGTRIRKMMEMMGMAIATTYYRTPPPHIHIRCSPYYQTH